MGDKGGGIAMDDSQISIEATVHYFLRRESKEEQIKKTSKLEINTGVLGLKYPWTARGQDL